MKLFQLKFLTNRLFLLPVAGVLYFFCARLGLLLAYENTNASPVWVPSGLALGLMLIFGRRIWPGIFAGAFAANLTVFLLNDAAGTSSVIFTSLAIAAGNTMEALAGRFLMIRFIGTLNIFEKHTNIFRFIVAALVASLVSCTAGTISLGISEIIPWGISGTVWYTWLLGDFSGILMITPLILVWRLNFSFSWNFKGVAEPVLITVLVVLISESIFIQHYSLGILSNRLYVLVPFLLWMVFRFGHREIISVLTVVSAFAIWGTVHGRGPFVSGEMNDSLLQLVAFIAIITITFMALSASLAEGRQTLSELKKHKEELEGKVFERTESLEQANAKLKTEMTEKEIAKAVLQKKTNQLDYAQQMAHIGSWEWNIKTGEEVWSDEQFRIFGFKPGEAVASYELFLNSLHAGDKECVLESLQLALEGKKEFDMEFRIVRGDETVRNIEARGEILRDAYGNPEKMIGTVMDITEKKNTDEKLLKSEELLQNVFTASTDGYWNWDLKTNEVFFSKRWKSMLGYDESEIKNVYDSFSAILHPDDSLRTYCEIEKHIKGETPHYSIEFRLKCRDGSYKWILSRGQIIKFDEERNPRFFVGTHVDIDFRKQIEFDLEKAKNEAETSAKIKETFLANMSHEIRTPMNAIVGFSSILSGTELDEKQTELVSNINSASENLLGLINDILDYSKIEAGMLKIENTVMHLPFLVESVHSIALGMAREKDLEISLSMSPTLPEYVVCDPTRLTQILMNLTNNAIKFTERGYVNIRVEVSKREGEVFLLKFIVSDSGTGIAEENREMIFERFSQEAAETTRKFGGTGLGLSIVKNIVSLMQGEILLESELGKGSEFIIFIPAGKCSDEQVASYQETQPLKNISGNQSINRLHILLAEDNRMNRQYCSMLLEAFGFTCSVACNGLEAIQKLKEETFDLILMDLQMPEMDGYEVTKILRAELKISTPVIAITANAITSEQKKCYEAGMNGYLAKPFRPESLRRYMEEIYLNKTGKLENAFKSVIGTTKDTQEKPIDITFLKEQVHGKMKGMKELIEIFLTDIPHDMKELKKMIIKQDYKSVGEKTHQMVSSFSILGITRAIEILKLMERNAEAEKHPEDMVSNFRQLEKIVANTEKQISEIDFQEIDSGIN